MLCWNTWCQERRVIAHLFEVKSVKPSAFFWLVQKKAVPLYAQCFEANPCVGYNTDILYFSYCLTTFLFVFLRQLWMHSCAPSFDGGDNLKAGIAADFAHGSNGTTRLFEPLESGTKRPKSNDDSYHGQVGFQLGSAAGSHQYTGDTFLVEYPTQGLLGDGLATLVGLFL